jgi:hypothetical protein
MATRAAEKKESTQGHSAELTSSSSHRGDKCCHTGWECRERWSYPGDVRCCHICPHHGKSNARQAGDYRNNRRQISLFDLKRQHSYAPQHEDSGKKTADQIARETPPCGNKLHGSSKNAKCREQDVISHLHHQKVPASRPYRVWRTINSRLPQAGQVPHRRIQPMRRSGEDCLPHCPHSACVQIGNRVSGGSSWRGHSTLR